LRLNEKSIGLWNAAERIDLLIEEYY